MKYMLVAVTGVAALPWRYEVETDREDAVAWIGSMLRSDGGHPRAIRYELHRLDGERWHSVCEFRFQEPALHCRDNAGTELRVT